MDANNLDKNPTPKSSKPFSGRLRDTKGQVIGLMSLVYIFVAVAFTTWLVNSGIALTYKLRMMNMDFQVAAAGATYMYFAPFYGWVWGGEVGGGPANHVSDYVWVDRISFVSNTPNFSGSYTPATYVSYNAGPGNSTAYITAGSSGAWGQFGGWGNPGTLSDVRNCGVPPAGSIPIP